MPIISFAVGGSTRILRRWMRPALTAGLGGVVVLLIGLWLAFQHRPVWYRPVVLDQAGAQQARRTAVATVDFVSDRMVEGLPFDVVLHSRSINRWLAAMPFVWPETRDAMPEGLRDPVGYFDDGEVRFAALYSTDRWRALVSVGFTLQVANEGSAITVTLNGAHSGALPVPRTILRDLLDELIGQTDPVQGEESGAAMSLTSLRRAIHSTDDLFAGVSLRNRFVWFNGDRPFRIESIAITPGELHLRVEPL